MTRPSVHPSSPVLPPHLTLRVGFAGRRRLSAAQRHTLEAALDSVYQGLMQQLSSEAVSEGAETRPKIARFYAPGAPTLRLFTGLCEGADAVAATALSRIGTAADEQHSGATVRTELAAVLPFDVDTYRRSRPPEARAEFDSLLATCSWVQTLDGIYDNPTDADLEGQDEGTRAGAHSLAKRRRARAYRAQSVALLRNVDVLIAAADPDATSGAGGTLETAQAALAFDLPVVFLHSETGSIYLVEPEEDLQSILSLPPPAELEVQHRLGQWVTKITADPDSDLRPITDSNQADTVQVERVEEFLSNNVPRRSFGDVLRAGTWRLYERFFKRGPAAARDVPLEPWTAYRRRAADLAANYAELYRGAVLLNYAAAVFAVALAAFSLAVLGQSSHSATVGHLAGVANALDSQVVGAAATPEPAQPLVRLLVAMASAKLLLLLFIFLNTQRARRKEWNARAVDFRYLAERLRAMHYLPRAGSHQPPAVAPPQFASRAVRQSAIDWLVDAIVRSASPGRSVNTAENATPTVVAIDPLLACERLRDGWIAEQAVYHRANAHTMGLINHSIEWLTKVLSALVILVVGVDLVVAVLEWVHYWQPAQAENVHRLAVVLVCTSAVLPAVVAALGGVRFQTECARLAERSAVMRVLLRGRAVAPPDTPDNRWWERWKRRVVTGLKTTALFLRHCVGFPPDLPDITSEGGRWQQANSLAETIRSATANQELNVGAWSTDVLRLTEHVATDFIQETAEWTVLYAKELSEPG